MNCNESSWISGVLHGSVTVWYQSSPDLPQTHHKLSLIHQGCKAVRLSGAEDATRGWGAGGLGGGLSGACARLDGWSWFNHDHHWWRGGVTPLWAETGTVLA